MYLNTVHVCHNSCTCTHTCIYNVCLYYKLQCNISVKIN